MSLNSLSGLLGQNASLLDYMGNGKSGLFDGVNQGIAQKVNQIINLANGGADQSGASANITLSNEAQALLAGGNGEANGKLTGVQKGAQNFMMSFFDESGIDFTKLSEQTVDLIQGLGDVIASSGGTVRDMATDAAESKYNANREVYTLTGTSARLRVAIDYRADGKPSKLSVTDIAGGQVETAEITLKNEDSVQTMQINRTQREYQNGHMVKLSDIDPLSVDLYTKA